MDGTECRFTAEAAIAQCLVSMAKQAQASALARPQCDEPSLALSDCSSSRDKISTSSATIEANYRVGNEYQISDADLPDPSEWDSKRSG